jgi:fused signal recognition particle receptor
MVFNWFRRQVEKSTSPSEQELEQAIESPTETPEQTEVDAATVAADTSKTSEAIDYLAFAKAAYQNIQQQQATPIEEILASDEDVTELSALDNLNPAVGAETVAVDSLVESTIDDIEEVESLVESTIDDTETSGGEEEEDTNDIAKAESNLPAWARDDRQSRLERLKATAIETVESEAPQPQLDLDEDFLWSAKVLADRGRTPEQVSLDEINWLKKLRQGLDKTRLSFVNQFKALLGQGPLDRDAVDTIETLLLQADVGIEATDYTIAALQAKLKEESLPPEEALAYLKQILRDLLDQPYQGSYQEEFMPVKDTLNIWLLTGVNGVGKTTTIGKLAHMSQSSGYQCLIAAADTFRAAAVEQVKVWGARSGIEVIANPGKNTDPAAVVYDAISAAQSRGTELLLVDTAGRLQNKKNLMDELSKIRRIIDKQAPNAQIESLLVLDATLGQNGLRQAQVFSEAAKLSGVVLTKLDGTAKGGVALAVVQQLGLPIRFIGAGEGIEDLRPFSSYEFVEALLSG